MKGKIFISVLVILAIIACHDEQIITMKSQPDLVIKTGTICGWCSKNDTMTIQNNSVRYVNYTGCSNVAPAVEKTGGITNNKVDSLLGDLNFNEFKKIDLNTCNVCFDGCDNWIFIEKDGESHYVRFTGNESELDPIKKFIAQLEKIKMSYQ